MDFADIAWTQTINGVTQAFPLLWMLKSPSHILAWLYLLDLLKRQRYVAQFPPCPPCSSIQSLDRLRFRTSRLA